MKKFLKFIGLGILSVAAVLAVAGAFSLFIGLQKVPMAIPEYTREVIYSKETPPQNYFYAMSLEAPEKDFFGYGSRCNAIYQKGTLQATDEKIDTEMKWGKDQICELLGITSDEYYWDYYISNVLYYTYEDGITVYYLDIGDIYNTTVRYENSVTIIVNDNGKSYMAFLSRKLGRPEYKSEYTGRVGDRYYFDIGYYDLKQHSIHRYESVQDLSDIPFYGIDFKYGAYGLEELLVKRPEVAAYFAESGDKLYGGYPVILADDRMHILFSGGNSDTAYYFMLDMTSLSILHAEKLTVHNYDIEMYDVVFLKRLSDHSAVTPYQK